MIDKKVSTKITAAALLELFGYSENELLKALRHALRMRDCLRVQKIWIETFPDKPISFMAESIDRALERK